MKIEETADGTIRVVELDPTKLYWIILEAGSMIRPEQIRKVDGLILVKRPDECLDIIENPETIVGAMRFTPPEPEVA